MYLCTYISIKYLQYIDGCRCSIISRSWRLFTNFKALLHVVILGTLHIGSKLKTLVPKVSLTKTDCDQFTLFSTKIIALYAAPVIHPSTFIHVVPRYLTQKQVINKTLGVPKPLIFFISIIWSRITQWENPTPNQ